MTSFSSFALPPQVTVGRKRAYEMSFMICKRALCVGMATALLLSSLATAVEPPNAHGPAVASGLTERVPWTSSRLAGSPDPPPPYRVQLAFPQLKFRQPLALTHEPQSNRLWIAEQNGRILSFVNDAKTQQADVVIDLKRVHRDLTAVYGLAFHPDFQQNHFVYICYVVGQDQDHGSRVSRFRVLPEASPRVDAESEQVIITWLAGGHNGGCLKFGPDGYLYISTGDGAAPSPPDPLNAGQDVGNLLSAILRIDVDHSDSLQAYRIPPDNPFVDVAGVRGEIWSFGFRNPWKMSFDRETGDLWVGDVGWELWEMVYRVQRGGNYGWSIMEGRQPVRPEDAPGPSPILPPTIDHPHSEAASITGGFVYRGQRLPELYGTYVYGDFQSGIVWGLRMQQDRVVWHKELAQTPLQLVAFGEDRDGELYLVDYRQQVFQLTVNTEPDTSAQFPRKLSETGLFSVVTDQTPAPGVLPYRINAEAWADYATTERWLAVPASDAIVSDDRGRWQFPNGTVIAKSISLEMERGQPGSRRRLETQILHREGDRWRPYTYAWNDAQTDAELVIADGATRTITVVDPDELAGTRTQQHRYYGRKECVLCHNPWIEASTMFGVQSASPLAMRTEQLDCQFDYGPVSANQLQTFRHIGLLRGSESRSSIPFVNPYDASADVGDRARAYLDVNCSHCHQLNAGGTATILLSASLALDKTRTLGERPTQGTFGISDASIISPGDPLGSVLYYRMAKLGGGRMPRVGSQEVDAQAVALVYDWIRQLSDSPSQERLRFDDLLEQACHAERAVDRAAAIDELTASTRGRCL